jgi:transposase-like protein
MDNISQLLQAIQSLSTQLFIFRTNIEPLTLLKSIPDDLADLINNPQLSELVDSACLAAKDLNEFLKPFLKTIYSYTHMKPENPDPMTPYADFKVDLPPIIKTDEYEQIKAEDILALEDILPVKRRKDLSYKGLCPHCGAGNEYIYSNNAKNQYLCKVCRKTFTDKITPAGRSGFYCPHCKSRLSPHHDRKGYTVYVCPSAKCPYYKENKAKKEAGDDLDLLTSSKQYRYHYHYREFKFNMDEIQQYTCQCEGCVDLTKIHVDPYTLALILTYYINYGMSSRKVSNVMYDIHGVQVSHQTVRNYAQSVSYLVKDMVDYYPYELSHTQAGDETYVHVMGKNHYVFFFSDPEKKIITSYYIFSQRDTRNAVISMYNVIRKFYPDLPDDLEFITDGNPIYNAAQLFFGMHGISFDLHQVIGVSNRDETSAKYRPQKQTEERLNRTFKQNYYPTNGYGSLDQANSYMVLYVAFFNFLRRHSSLGYNTPVHNEEIDGAGLMPDKWLKIIQMSSQYHPEVPAETAA